MAAHGYAPPKPLPSNHRGWSAFIRVCHARHAPMGQPWMPNWSDIESVLTLYGLWDVDVHGRLSVCFSELMTMEAESKKADHG